MAHSASTAHKKTFTWENLNYTVPVPGGELRLLHDVFGYVKPGTLTALMGASGAGKPALLIFVKQQIETSLKGKRHVLTF